MAATPLKCVTIEEVKFLAKLEYLNFPSGSLDDRWVSAEIAAHQQKHALSKDNSKIVVTGSRSSSAVALLSGNVKKIYAVVSEDMVRPINELKLLGAEIVRTHKEANPGSTESTQNLAKRLAADTNSLMLDEHEARKSAYKQFAEELYSQSTTVIDTIIIPLENDVDPSFGLADALKKCFGQNLLVIGVVINETLLSRKRQPRTIIGVSEQVQITFLSAAKSARALMQQGYLCGILSGAAAKVAVDRVKSGQSQNVIVVFDDSSRLYQSTIMSPTWLNEQKFLEDDTLEKINRFRGACIEDLQLPEAVSIPRTCKVDVALDIMISRDFSQLPVIDDQRKMVGWITLGALQSNIADASLQDIQNEEISSWMYKFKKSDHYKVITPSTSLSDLESFWEYNLAAFVTDESGKFPLAVVTK
ncbi:hypothetical protein HK096_010288 [Nowakowskiella sp. JEL0078]|nr:hypothetical protein HK096_010288 [Nowakowskiella sp. JEL0078]